MNKKVLINIFSLLGIQGIGYIIPLLTLPYLVRVLGPNGYGVYGYSLAIIQYFILLVDFGFNLSITKKISQNRDDKEQVSKFFWNTISCKILLFLLGLALITVWGIVDNVFKGNIEILYASYTIVFGNMIFPIWLFQGKEEMSNIAISNIFAKFIAVPLIFLLVKSPKDIWLAGLINGFAFVLAGIIGLYIVYKKKWIIWCKPNFKDMLDAYRNAWHIFISTAAINIYTSSITVFLGIFTTPAVVGYFVAADKIRLAIQGLIGPVSQALYPRISAMMINNKEKAFSTIRLLLKIQGGGALLLSFLLFYFSDEIIITMYGKQYVNSIIIMKILAWMPFVIATSNVFGYQTLLALNMEKIFSRAVLFGAGIALLIIYPAIVSYGALGAALTIFITELVVNQIMMIVIIRKKLPIFTK